jgi:hypothetical protein
MFCVSCGFALPSDPIPGTADPLAAGEPEPAAGVLAASGSAPPAAVHPPADAPAASPDAQPDAASAPEPTGPIAGPLPARPSLAQLAALVVGVSLGVAAIAVALTLALAPPGPGPVASTDAGDLQVVEVANIRAEVPTTWAVVRRAGDTIAVHDQARRVLWLRSARLPTAISLDAIQEQALKRSRDGSPDARICAGPDGAPVPGGPADGRYFVICYTFIPQGGGPAVPLADAYYVGTESETATFMMQLTAVPEALEAFAGAVRQLPAPLWKLHGG